MRAWWVVALVVAGCLGPTHDAGDGSNTTLGNETTSSETPTPANVTEPEVPVAPVKFVWHLATGYNASSRRGFHDIGPPDTLVDLPFGTPAAAGWMVSIVYRPDEPWPAGAASPECSYTIAGHYEPEYVYDCRDVEPDGVHVLNASSNWRTFIVPLGANGTTAFGFPGNATIRYIAVGGEYTQAMLDQVDAERCNLPVQAVGSSIDVGPPGPGADASGNYRAASGALRAVMPWFGYCV
jgi:hypothetical protein